MAENLQRKLSDYQNLEKNIQKQLKSSKTAYSASPSTTKDQALEAKYRDIVEQREKVQSDILNERWYGNKIGEEEADNEGILMRGLNALATPLYGIVGAAEAVTGKGNKKGLANITENIKERETFSDLLKKFSAPTAISAPVGFALDVAFDPVNWYTAGTAALIPRVVKGMTKAGTKGATKGLVSGGLQKTATATKFIPFLRKKAPKLAEKATKAATEYDELIGRNLADILEKNAARPGFGKYTESIVKKLPNGDKISEAFKYSPSSWYKRAKAQDDLINLHLGQGAYFTGSPYQTRQFLDAIERLSTNVADNVPQIANDLFAKGDDIIRGTTSLKRENANRLNDFLNEGVELMTENADLARASNPLEVGGRLIQEATDDKAIDEIFGTLKNLNLDKTGVKWYDDMMKSFRDYKIKDVEVGKKILDSYDKYIKLFKIGKVGLSPSAYTNAVVGNLTMPAMAGIKVFDKGLLSSVKNAFNLLEGKVEPKTINQFLQNPDWVGYMDKYPGVFRKTFGFSPNFLYSKNAIDDILSHGVSSGMINEAQLMNKGDDVARLLNKEKKGLADKVKESIFRKSQKAGGKVLRATTPRSMIETQANRAATGIMSADDVPTSYLTAEIMDDAFAAWKRDIDKKASSGNLGYKLLKAYIEKPMDWYERIDQSYKLGTAMHLTKNGITESELLKLSRTIPLSMDDITETVVDGVKKYKISADKATELAGEIYMNYAAMPGAVKVLRSMPFFGAPFASFMYAMGAKTGKTAFDNPALFNKVQLALHDFSGTKGPLEKKALDSKYYKWYNQGGMTKLPFFKKNPVYLNVANMIPYYTMNIFQPTERKYGKGVPDAITSAIDKLPFLKTPEGQVIFDYFIQPILLRESNPQGAFGQPLFPKDATLAEKLKYSARGAAESITPGIIGLAGLATPSEKILEVAPSYRWRQLGYATRGKTPIGAKSKEPAVQRTLRALMSQFGVPTYPMNLDYQAYEAKKKYKNLK